MNSLHTLVSVLGDVVPNPPPVAIPGLEPKSNMVLGWVKTGDLIAIVACALAAIIMIPAGKFAGNKLVGNVGVGALGGAAIGAILYVIAIPALNALLS